MPATLKPHYQVLVIGAGINGCGLFRDLCLQGIDCLLIDRGDVCGGASSASSRLIHGGLKYLETGDFRLVRESAAERNRLLRNAPHCVKPLETVLPVTSWFGGLATSLARLLGARPKLNDRGLFIVEAGLRIYDGYNRQIMALPGHRILERHALHADHPGLDASIIAAGLYYEGVITAPERLGLELVMDGIAAHPASTLCSYTTATQGEEPGTLHLADQLSPVVKTITADVIVNAAGAWIDSVNAALGITSRHIGGSKGSHLVLDNPALHRALAGRMIYFGTADGRVNLVYPLRQHVLLGSTDIAIADPDAAACSAAETGYLLDSLRQLFPAIPVGAEQIRFTTCGVRPLPRSTGTDIGAVSRDHAIRRDARPGFAAPVLSLVGGKWTTFRAFSEQAADEVLSLLGATRRISTADLAIGGGRGFPVKGEEARWALSLAEGWGLAPARAAQLLARYGTEAEALAQFTSAAPDAALRSCADYSRREIAYLAGQHVRRLADILFRRTSLAIDGALTEEVVREVAAIAAASLGWTAHHTGTEITHALAELDRHKPEPVYAKAA